MIVVAVIESMRRRVGLLAYGSVELVAVERSFLLACACVSCVCELLALAFRVDTHDDVVLESVELRV